MKKILALLLAMMMVFALAACGGNEENPSGSGSNTQGSSEQDKTPTDGAGLTAEQQALIDSFGKTTEELTIVAYKESEKYVSYFVFIESEDDLPEQKLYRLYKSEEWYRDIAYNDDGECIFDEDRHSDDLRWILLDKSDYPFKINLASSYQSNRDKVVEAGYTLVE